MMRIAEIKIENFKIFKGEHLFKFDNNLVFFVGENNTGKTTLFEAVNFLKAGLPKDKDVSDIKNLLSDDKSHVSCTIKFVGQIKDVIKDFSESKYEPYVFEENGGEALLVQRSSEERTIKQSGKDKNLSIKTITIWNKDTQQFENPAGIDAAFSTLFETQFIWADSDPKDISDFGATKVCGRLLLEAVGDFFKGPQWENFAKVHKETFHGNADSLSKRTESVENRITKIISEQYGKADVKFDFSLPDTSTFFKAGDITVNDGVETRLDDKGTGMQRAVALAMIQVYGQYLATHKSDPTKSKPIFFFIDEPEICLHPKAQKQLLEALVAISKFQQIFVSTHSPYLLKSFDSTSHSLIVFNRNSTGDGAESTPSTLLKLFKWSPSWGEINFAAFSMPTMEFHDELYGSLHEKYISGAVDDTEANRRRSVNNFDFEYLASSDVKKQTSKWSELKKGAQQKPYAVTLHTFIRHKVHHPESIQTDTYSEKDLLDSIDGLIAMLK